METVKGRKPISLDRILNRSASRTRKRVAAVRNKLSRDTSYQTLCGESRDYLDWLLARAQDHPLLFSVPVAVLDSLEKVSRSPRKT